MSDAAASAGQPGTKQKKVQKGKVGKGKLSYAQCSKISKVCQGEEKMTLENKTEIIKLHKTLKWSAKKVVEKFKVKESTA